MTPSDLIDDLRSRINPAYAAQLGTESYERRLCAEALESLMAEQETLCDELARLRTQRDYIMSAARRTLHENGHLADGDNCTLIVLKRAFETLIEVSAARAGTKPAPWPIMGVRVEDNKVIVIVKGGNDAARWLCGELLAMRDALDNGAQF